jgi:hypothetical protein
VFAGYTRTMIAYLNYGSGKSRSTLLAYRDFYISTGVHIPRKANSSETPVKSVRKTAAYYDLVLDNFSCRPASTSLCRTLRASLLSRVEYRSRETDQRRAIRLSNEYEDDDVRVQIAQGW